MVWCPQSAEPEEHLEILQLMEAEKAEKSGKEVRVLAVLRMENSQRPSTTPVFIEVQDPNMRIRDVALHLRLHLQAVEPHEIRVSIYGVEQWLGEKGPNTGSRVSGSAPFAPVGAAPTVYTMQYRKRTTAGNAAPASGEKKRWGESLINKGAGKRGRSGADMDLEEAVATLKVHEGGVGP